MEKIKKVPHLNYDNLRGLNLIASKICNLSGFKNTSDSMDVCPSLSILSSLEGVKKGLQLTIYVNYLDTSLSTFDDVQYSVSIQSENDTIFECFCYKKDEIKEALKRFKELHKKYFLS